MRMSDESAHLLIWAIVEKACNDYLFYKRQVQKYSRNTNYIREYNSTVMFFRSTWFDTLMPNIAGEKVIEKLDQIYNKGETIDVCEQQLRESLENLP